MVQAKQQSDVRTEIQPSEEVHDLYTLESAAVI